MTEDRGARVESWKAIARYFGRSERTVRRWETDEGLPVHRHMHRAQGSVYAYEAELEHWRHSRGAPEPKAPMIAARTETETEAIVVLPFAYLGDDPSRNYLALGFADELTTDLSRLGDIRVISRTSAAAVAGRGIPVAEIAELLNVDFLIEGALRQQGDNLRISIQLIRCDSDECLWSESYECRLDELFETQSTLARAAVAALRRRLTAQDEAALRMRAASDRRVWEIVVRARAEALRWTPAGIANAIGLLERGIKEAGPQPDLLAALGRYHLFERETGFDMSAAPMAAARDCLAKLEAAAPGHPQAHHLRGWLAYQQGRMSEAIRSLRQANDAAPDDPDTLALLAYCYLLSGLDALAQPLVERLLVLDPLTPINHSLDACADLFAGRFAAAAAKYSRMRDLDPANRLSVLFHVMALSLAGERDEAARLAKAHASAPDGAPVDRVLQAFAAAARGESVPGAVSSDSMIEASTVDMFPRLMAQACGLGGDDERAIYWLRLAAARGFAHYPFIVERDPSFACLRGDETFGALAGDIHKRWVRLKEEFAPQSAP